jgi:hypothetical protein
MEHAIEEPGKHLAALQKFIAAEVPVILKESPAPDTLTSVIDERVYRVRQEIYKGHLAHADAQAHTRYLALRQLTLLELVGHLLEYTRPIQLYSTLSHRTPTDDICRHLYRRLESLLNYTVEILANGQIDPGLTLPPAAYILYQHMLGSGLVALRERFAALHVSPRLIDMVLLPFEDLRHDDYITFHTAVYLRALKQKLQALAGGEQQSPGDGDMLDLLVAQNFNEPRFVDYYHQVMEGQLETRTSWEARLDQLRDYKIRLAHYTYSTRLAWRPDQPSVRQQLTEWLDKGMAATAPVIPVANAVGVPKVSSDEDDYDIPDGVLAADALMYYIHPAIFGTIANAAHKLGIIHLGDTDKQRAALISQIPSFAKRVKAETILRAFDDETACRKALPYVEQLASHLRAKIKKT